MRVGEMGGRDGIGGRSHILIDKEGKKRRQLHRGIGTVVPSKKAPHTKGTFRKEKGSLPKECVPPDFQ